MIRHRGRREAGRVVREAGGGAGGTRVRMGMGVGHAGMIFEGGRGEERRFMGMGCEEWVVFTVHGWVGVAGMI